MTSFTITLLISILYSGLFLLTGSFIIEKLYLPNKDKFPKLYLLGSGFFIGCGLFLSLWIILASLLHSAKLGLFLSTLVVIVISFLFLIRKTTTLRLKPKQSFLVILLFLTLIGFGTFKALTPMPNYYLTNPEAVNPFSSFGGVVHSFRAGNISEYIVLNDTLPIINQHSGQSILASIPMFIANQSAQLSLVIWLNIFIGFLIITIYGFLRQFFTKPIHTLIPLSIIFLGNTVLSPFYSSITDAESALLLSANIDVIFGIASFFILLISLYKVIVKEASFNWFIFLLIVLGLVWNITSSEMIILLLLSFVIILFTFRKRLEVMKTLGVPVMYFVLAAILGSLTIGGMLSPIKSEVDIPGLMSLKVENEPLISLRFPRTGEGNAQNLNNFKNLYSTIKNPKVNSPQTTPVQDVQTNSDLKNEIKDNSLLWDIARLVRSFQLVFFPILGIFIAYYLLFKSKIPSHLSDLFRFLLINTTALFLVGWVASTVFKLYGYYWELSKFLYTGSFLAMLMFGLALSLILINTKRKYSKLLIIATIIFVTIGPITEYFVVRPLNNIYMNPALDYKLPDSITEDQTKLQTLSVSDRFNLLISSKGIYGQNY